MSVNTASDVRDLRVNEVETSPIRDVRDAVEIGEHVGTLYWHDSANDTGALARPPYLDRKTGFNASAPISFGTKKQVDDDSQRLSDTKAAKEVSRATDTRRWTYRFVKRTFDILVSALIIVIGFIPAFILSFIIRKDTGGSAIYSQERVGKSGKIFKIYKFRTMVADADNVEKYLSPEQLEMWHKERKVDDDPRITSLGLKLRHTSVDEFPQFINVFLGQMSIVGPRPLSAEEVEYFGKDKDLLLSVPAGITGLWQTGERNLATFETGLRQDIELLYVKNASITLDLHIFFRTFKTMVERTGR